MTPTMNTNTSHHRRFIFDFDDTISHTFNRDWDNAEPDQVVIDKINELFENGFEIWICTARGMLSCNGDLALREKTYRTSIETWLRNHNVHYHVLSFEKVLGAYYVDDKAIHVNDFKKMSFKILHGLSGTDVFITDEKFVSKTCENALQVAAWHERARDLQIRVPKVHSVIGKTLNMDYIKGERYKPGTFIHKLRLQIDDFRNYRPMHHADFATYIERIQAHLDESELSSVAKELMIEKLESIEHHMNKEKSFCHGDYSIDNVIITSHGWYLIDPNPTDYSSWLLDLSKLKMSLYRFGYDDDYETLSDKILGHYGMAHNDAIFTLELSHWVRILKYVRHLPNQQSLYNKAFVTIEHGVHV
jgi:capsule biosynthesis phosphatase